MAKVADSSARPRHNSARGRGPRPTRRRAPWRVPEPETIGSARSSPSRGRCSPGSRRPGGARDVVAGGPDVIPAAARSTAARAASARRLASAGHAVGHLGAQGVALPRVVKRDDADVPSIPGPDGVPARRHHARAACPAPSPRPGTGPAGHRPGRPGRRRCGRGRPSRPENGGQEPERTPPSPVMLLGHIPPEHLLQHAEGCLGLGKVETRGEAVRGDPRDGATIGSAPLRDAPQDESADTAPHGGAAPG